MHLCNAIPMLPWAFLRAGRPDNSSAAATEKKPMHGVRQAAVSIAGYCTMPA